MPVAVLVKEVIVFFREPIMKRDSMILKTSFAMVNKVIKYSLDEIL